MAAKLGQFWGSCMTAVRKKVSVLGDFQEQILVGYPVTYPSFALRSRCVSFLLTYKKMWCSSVCIWRVRTAMDNLVLVIKRMCWYLRHWKMFPANVKTLKALLEEGDILQLLLVKTLHLHGACDFQNTFLSVSLLVWCCHLSVDCFWASTIRSCKTGTSLCQLTQCLGKLGKFLFCSSRVVPLWLCEDCFLSCFI